MCETQAEYGSDTGLGEGFSHAAKATGLAILVSNSVGVKNPSAASRRLRWYFISIHIAIAERHCSRVIQVCRMKTLLCNSGTVDSIAALSSAALTRAMEPTSL